MTGVSSLCGPATSIRRRLAPTLIVSQRAADVAAAELVVEKHTSESNPETPSRINQMTRNCVTSRQKPPFLRRKPAGFGAAIGRIAALEIRRKIQNRWN
jgi:hypothetical protein